MRRPSGRTNGRPVGNGQGPMSFTNAVRRAVFEHTAPPRRIAERINVPAADFIAFLTGESELPSNAIDRLCKLLKLTFQLPSVWPIERIRVRRIYGTLTPAQLRRLRKVRKQIAEELPDLIRRNQQSHDAAQEDTVSGALRRAIHGCHIMLAVLETRSQVDSRDLNDFLHGERSLGSGAMDRLAAALKLTLAGTGWKPKPRTAKAS